MSASAFSLLHPGVQKAIFAMGWKELHPIQVSAIQQIISGSQYIVITAQTAGGKTEAAFLPIISKIAANPQPSIQALYVGPLKALINDQFSRLERLCRDLDIPVHRWHGDVSPTQKRALRERPAGILLITPESLESNFINYGVQVPRIYSSLEFVVIDELHSFLDNVRGVHLRSLLTRVSHAIDSNPRLVGLSATIGDPRVAQLFVSPENPEQVHIINDPNSKREIRLGVKAYLRRPRSNNEKLIEPRVSPVETQRLAQVADFNSSTLFHKENAPELQPSKADDTEVGDEELDEIAADVVRNFTKSTNLIFVNAKRTIETLAVKLHERVQTEKLPVDPFVVHHGSLSKEVREDAEAALKDPAPTTAICSSTLEMGIDIGAVRAVGQVDTPWSVSSMVQRLGRSGRREGEPAIMRMYVREDAPSFASGLTDLLFPDLLRAIALTELMLAKWLEPADIGRLHLSTLTHQILSCLKQTGGLPAAKLHDLLVVRGPFKAITAAQFALLLRGLGAKQLIEQTPQSDLILAPLGEKITSSFDFYSAFQSTEEFFVRNGEEQIGSLPADAIPPVGEHLILAGRRWRVEEIDPVTTTVFVTPTRGGKTPVFRSARGDLHTRVVQQMRATLLATDEPAYLDEHGKLLLRAARVIASRSGLDQRSVLIGQNRIQWFPWVGTRCLRTLSLCAKAAQLTAEVDEISLTYRGIMIRDFEAHLRDIRDRRFDTTDLAALLSIRMVDKFDGWIPDTLLNEANGRNRLDIGEASAVAHRALSAFEQRDSSTN